MWQRIQTLYLLVSSVLVFLLLFVDKAVVPGAESGQFVEKYRFTAYVPYLVLIIIITLLNILSLTSYKFRVFQMRTAVLSALITLALQAWIAVDYFSADSSIVFRLPAVFPIVAVICDLLAAKGIYSDELVVKAYSRLRTTQKNKKRK